MCHMDIPGLDALMNISATILLAFGMSMDAFAASIGKGATLHKPKFSDALRTGLIFGAIETLTPLIGWGLGMLASQFVLEWNHWIAFVLLVFLGGRMVIEGFRGNGDEDDAPLQRHGFWLLVTTAIATSLDAIYRGCRSGVFAGQYYRHRAGDWLRHADHVNAGDDGGSVHWPAVRQTSRNSGRYRVDRDWCPNPLGTLRGLTFALPAMNAEIRLAAKFCLRCQRFPHLWFCPPCKRRHLQ